MTATVNGTRRSEASLVFILAFLLFAYFMPQWADWNIDSRIDLVHAVVDRHTVRIDQYHWNTWDKAVYKGHYYSDKAPGTAALGVPIYAAFVLAHRIPVLRGGISLLEKNDAWGVAIRLGQSSTQKQPGPAGTNLAGCQRLGGAGNVQYIPWGNRLVPPMRDWALSKYVVTIGVDALLSAAFAVFLFWFLAWFILGAAVRWLAVALYSGATVALPYSSNFYSHQLAAGMLFTAFGLIYLRGRGVVGRWAAPLAGFLLGFALFTEYTVAIIAVIIAVYAIYTLRSDVRAIGITAIAGAVPLVGLMAYNVACFGRPTDTGYSHDFCWSAAQAAGFAGFTYPHAGPLFDLTLGPYRVLFFSSPYLLLAAAGARILWRSSARLEAAVLLVLPTVFILTLSAYWGWNGGRVDGPRYLVPAVPFLAFLAAISLPSLLRRAWGRILVVVLGAWSVFATWTLFLGGETFPTSWLRDPLFDFSLPALRDGTITPNAGLFMGLSGWASLVPLPVALALVLLLALALRRVAEEPIGRD